MQPTAARLAARAREAGYEVARVEQLRTNRWLLTLRDGDGAATLLMVQQRPIVTAADVQDLAELLQCARVPRGLLLAYEGSFSPEARRTAVELRRRPIQLCTELPTTGRAAEAAQLVHGGVRTP